MLFTGAGYLHLHAISNKCATQITCPIKQVVHLQHCIMVYQHYSLSCQCMLYNMEAGIQF